MRKSKFPEWILSLTPIQKNKTIYGQKRGRLKASADTTLIVYLSLTRNTEAIAEIIHKKIGGTLVALELEKPYPDDYEAIVTQVTNENATGFLPPLKTKIDNIGKYEYIFIGFPNWGMLLPPPIKTFLNQYELSGKTIIPFNTHTGYGAGSTFLDIKGICHNSTVLEGLSTRGGERSGYLLVAEGNKKKYVEEKVNKWLQKIGFIK